MMRLAIIADIHGNAPALEAVLADISEQSFDAIVHLGDAFNGPIDPVGVLRWLQSRPMIHLRGNGDRMVVADNDAERSQSAAFARSRLPADALPWIATWPEVYEHAEFFACHGTPASDVEYLVEDPTEGALRLRAPGEIAARLGGVHSGLVLCGHSHIPHFIKVTHTTCVLNPGSVGLPAYSPSTPVPHTMQTGSPAARYAIAEKKSDGWRVSHLAIPYDYEKAAAAADREGFPDWAATLRSGYAV